MLYLTYNLVLLLLLPGVLFLGLLGGRSRWRLARDVRGRIETGSSPPWEPGEAPTVPPILCHAASVGEVRAIEILVRRLRRDHPGIPLVLTTSTGNGRDEARRRDLAPWVQFLPLDYPFLIEPFLAATRPGLVLVAESEVWPNFLAGCYRRDIPVFFVNCRLSPAREDVYFRLASLYERVLHPVSRFLMQGPEDARRLRRMGIRPDRIEVVGDLKADRALESVDQNPRPDLARRMGLEPGDGPVLVAGSTHPGEEELFLDILHRLRPEHPRLRLVLAPRHLERTPDLLALVASRGEVWQRVSDGSRGPDPDGSSPSRSLVPVVVLDTFGELADAYALADVTAVGGSWVPVGGHSVVEPAVRGVPVVVGPHAFNFDRDVEALAQAGVLRVRDAGEPLLLAVADWMRDPGAREAAGRAGRRGVRAMAGALDRTMEILLPCLPRANPPEPKPDVS